jgi:hypothetical protein
MDNWGQGTFTLYVSRLYRRAIGIPNQRTVALVRLPATLLGFAMQATVLGPPVHVQLVQIGSKDGALPHYCGTSPPSALRTGQATPRGIRLASEGLSTLARRWARMPCRSPMRSSSSVPPRPGPPSPVVLRPVPDFLWLPGGARRPRLLRPLCPDWPRSRPKPVALLRQGEARQFPGNYKGTLTSEGGLPSAFPPLWA